VSRSDSEERCAVEGEDQELSENNEERARENEDETDVG
jgi:hypothetical protein